MLAPRHRTLLLDALRPPVGFRLVRAVATTYTLDLVALLTAPLAFTYADAHDEEGRIAADPLALLEGLRRHARNIHVFCHAGAIHPPRPGQRLLSQLEECVVEVVPPRPGGVFHPKLWLLAFEARTGEERERCFRLVVGTRNLTFDRSWDSVLVLDGQPGGGRAAKKRNAPIANLVAALPNMAVVPVDERCRLAVQGLASDVLDVVWQVPKGFEEDELRFHVFGLAGGGGTWPFAEEGRRLVMAPFVDAWFLEKFANERPRNVVIGRAEALAEVDERARARYGECFVLADDANSEEEDEDGGVGPSAGVADGESVSLDSDFDGTAPSGLHAKLFIVQQHLRARVFTGSANATRAAFERNVEILVELDGGIHNQGIPALLGESEGAKGTLRDLLEPWTPPERPADVDPVLLELERDLEALRDRIARAALRVVATASSQPSDVTLALRGTWPGHADGFTVAVRPASLVAARAVDIPCTAVDESDLARFETPLLDATSFFVFEVTGRRAGHVQRVSFARRLGIEGLPADRAEHLLRGLLTDKSAVARFLGLLLADGEIDVAQVRALASAGGPAVATTGAPGGLPLFEALVRAAERGPDALEPVRRLVEDLSRSERGRALLPEGFERIWEPIRRASEALQR